MIPQTCGNHGSEGNNGPHSATPTSLIGSSCASILCSTNLLQNDRGHRYMLINKRGPAIRGSSRFDQWIESKWHRSQEVVYMNPHAKDILRSVPSTLKTLYSYCFCIQVRTKGPCSESLEGTNGGVLFSDRRCANGSPPEKNVTVWGHGP